METFNYFFRSFFCFFCLWNSFIKNGILSHPRLRFFLVPSRHLSIFDHIYTKFKNIGNFQLFFLSFFCFFCLWNSFIKNGILSHPRLRFFLVPSRHLSILDHIYILNSKILETFNYFFRSFFCFFCLWNSFIKNGILSHPRLRFFLVPSRHLSILDHINTKFKNIGNFQLFF